MTTPIRTCSRCGCTADNLIEFHDRLLCPDCLDSMTDICVGCGTRFWNRECLTNDHGDPICPDCCDRNYTRCTRCGSPIFYGAGPRFFGVELEIDGAGEDSENASMLLNIANRKHSFA